MAPDESLEDAPPDASPNNPRVVVSMYLIPLVACLLFWTLQDSSRWVGGPRPIGVQFLIGLWQTTGPCAWFVKGPRDPSAVVATFLLTWLGWISAVLNTRLREMHYATHFLASCLRCLAGCPPAGLAMT